MKVLDLSISKSMILNINFPRQKKNAIFKWLVHRKLNNHHWPICAVKLWRVWGFRTLRVTDDKLGCVSHWSSMYAHGKREPNSHQCSAHCLSQILWAISFRWNSYERGNRTLFMNKWMWKPKLVFAKKFIIILREKH